MSFHLPVVKPRQIIQILKKRGFKERRITGSHHIFRHAVTGCIVPVPVHGNKDLKKGTLRNILKLADISLAELHQFLES
ncbi:MAG: type II toxin-antitoxin system HicA family toxin [Deltaproteobacteria bacterium]|nr:type II toxin-antitoxin system HicA family toxin [Deltaproteobacteria bacterium]